MSALISLAGVAVLLLPAWLLSSDRGAIRVRTVVGAFLVQAGLGAFVLYFPLGQRALVAVTRVVQAVMDSAQAGMDFLFGGLVGDAAAEGGLGIIFAFSVLPLIIFFSSLIAAPLVVRPFIARMTESELFAVMVGGLASVAGSVLAGYAALGVELRYLIAASFMAAPGGLLMAKIMKPRLPASLLHQCTN